MFICIISVLLYLYYFGIIILLFISRRSRTEAISKKLFLKISQNSQESEVVESLFKPTKQLH